MYPSPRQSAPHGTKPCDEPANQPKGRGGTCEIAQPPAPPALPEPAPCKPACECPYEPPTPPSCFDELIEREKKEIAEAERAKPFLADLEAMLALAKAASLEYTQDRYTKLVDAWTRNDIEIAELIRKLECAVPCWRCLIECFVCPLLEEVRVREVKLYGEGKLIAEVRTLHDLRYWHDRNLDAARRRYERIKAVLTAWQKPAQAIEKAIADCRALIADAGKLLAPDAAKVVYDVFLKLVPLHLAIAPPASPETGTRIGKEFTVFCECDVGVPDDCCGPDVGVPTLRQRLVAPQAYLVPPSDFFPILCCLAKERYLPAKQALSSAESAFAEVDAKIKRFPGEVEERLKALEKTAKGAMPADCKTWQDEPCQPSGRPAR